MTILENKKARKDRIFCFNGDIVPGDTISWDDRNEFLKQDNSSNMRRNVEATVDSIIWDGSDFIISFTVLCSTGDAPLIKGEKISRKQDDLYQQEYFPYRKRWANEKERSIRLWKKLDKAGCFPERCKYIKAWIGA